jgi:hypothetical protein
MLVVDGDELSAAIARLEKDPFFLASTFATYRIEYDVTDAQLAKVLDCDVETVKRLSLCRAPRVEGKNLFVSDVRAVAKYASCDWVGLSRVVRAAQAISTLKRFGATSDSQLLKAARDKHGKRNGKSRRDDTQGRRTRMP